MIKVTKHDGEIGRVKLNVINGKARFSSDVQGSFEIVWEGHTYVTPESTYDDITVDDGITQNSIQLNFSFLDLGTDNTESPVDLTFNLELRDRGGNSGTISQTVTTNNSAPLNLYFPYNQISGVELTEIEYISLYSTDFNEGEDFNFDFLQTSEVVSSSF